MHKWSIYNRTIPPIPGILLKKLILFILNNCTFEINNEFYRQNYGTTMGASFSVRFANIYMHKFLTNFCASCTSNKPSFLARLIDDIFFISQNNSQELQLFFNELNSFHNTIKFEPTTSKTEVNFLDTTVYIDEIDNTMHTKLYTKPTYRVQYLHYSSNHPQHVKKALPFSQALRIRRICDQDEKLSIYLDKLKTNFVSRGYPSDLIDMEINKVNTLDRLDTLKYKTPAEKKKKIDNFTQGAAFLPLIITFDSRFNITPNLKFVLKQNWLNFLSEKANIKMAFEKSTPKIIFKKGTTLSNLLIKAKLTTNPVNLDENDRTLIDILDSLDNENNETVDKCHTPRCNCCNIIDIGPSFNSAKNNSHFFVNRNMNCSSKNVIYLISCKKCRLQYVGETSMRLKDRLNNHMSTIRTNKNTAVAIHFNQTFHTIDHVIIKPIELVDINDKKVRLEREKLWIKTLNTRYPNGLNCYPIDYNRN
jgi:hypothetical protein